jgi:hypothetical protein
MFKNHVTLVMALLCRTYFLVLTKVGQFFDFVKSLQFRVLKS